MAAVRIFLPSRNPSLRAQRSNPASLRMCHGLLRFAAVWNCDMRLSSPELSAGPSRSKQGWLYIPMQTCRNPSR